MARYPGVAMTSICGGGIGNLNKENTADPAGLDVVATLLFFRHCTRCFIVKTHATDCEISFLFECSSQCIERHMTLPYECPCHQASVSGGNSMAQRQGPWTVWATRPRICPTVAVKPWPRAKADIQARTFNMKANVPVMVAALCAAVISASAHAGDHKTYGAYYAWDNNFNNSAIAWSPSTGSYPQWSASFNFPGGSLYGYPASIRGWHYGWNPTGDTLFPRKISSVSTIPAAFSYASDGSNMAGDFAYDLFLRYDSQKSTPVHLPAATLGRAGQPACRWQRQPGHQALLQCAARTQLLQRQHVPGRGRSRL